MKAVGVGKNAAKNLDRTSADAAMTALLTGEFNPVTFGAFFMAMRYKGETPEELAGFLDALNRTAYEVDEPPVENLLSCAGAYDGKSRTCNVSIPAALVTAAAGVPIVIHGSIGTPTKFGMTSDHVLRALGVATDSTTAEVGNAIRAHGIGYIAQKQFLPRLYALLPMRNEMGKRTILNTLETLTNPMKAANHIGGFFHDAYAELIGNALKLDCSKYQRATLVKGIEGSDELRPGGVFIGRLVDGEYFIEAVNSDELGLPVHISELSAPTESVEQRVAVSVTKINELFDQPKRDSGFRNAVLLNAAVRIYTAGKCGTIAESVEAGRAALESGAASDLLSKWQALSYKK